MRPRLLDLGIHLARLVASVVAIALAARLQSLAAMVAGAGLLFLEGFAFAHDLMHGALRLPRRANEVLLALSGALLLMSGHALRFTHRIHHAHPLAADDEEGRPARGSLLAALLGGPLAAPRLRLHAFSAAGRRGRIWQAAETSVDGALLIALLASGWLPLRIYVLVALAAQATMSVWAAHVPHNAPAWLTAAAARFDWTGSPTMLALAHHEMHHAHPELPCRWLASPPEAR